MRLEVTSGPALRAALRTAAAAPGPVEIHFPPGEYHLWPHDDHRRELYVSNTVGADPRYRSKAVALLVEGVSDLRITGPGARLVLHGLQTTFAILGSSRVRIEGLEFDYAVPTVVDATVASAGVEGGRAYRVLRVPAVSPYTIVGRSVLWHGEPTPAGGYTWWGWDALDYTQVFTPARRVPNPLFTDVHAIRRTPEGLRIEYDHAVAPTDVGLVYAMRRTARDHPGALISGSEDVTLSGLRFRYLHGFGVVAQQSQDVTVENCSFATPVGSGRHTAGFADFLQVSGCWGHLAVRDSVFDGSHDDPINVHGTYLRVGAQPRADKLLLHYVHPETAGLPQFAPGDEIEVVDRGTLQPVAAARVSAVRQPSGNSHDEPLTSILLTVDAPLPPGLIGTCAVENITRTPSVEITGNVFRNTPTRGVLVTTRRPVLIKNNRFERTGMASIYVSADANEWWESGPVRDLTIRDNDFHEPGGPAVLIEPQAAGSAPVHSGVAVEDNRFELGGQPALRATLAGAVSFERNDVAP